MNQRNYQKELEKLLELFQTQHRTPRLFLHSCCAPCSSYVLEYLAPFFEITVFYYNPNISGEPEYRKRVEEQKRLISIFNRENKGHPISILEGDYEPSCFYDAVKGLEKLGEGSERCFRCFDLRLRETVRLAKEGDFDYFGTTLTISPLKNAAKLNEIGFSLEQEFGIPWLPSDFKKKNGYKRSVELSAQYELYRQDFCGCAFSKAEKSVLPKQENRLTNAEE